MKTIYPKNKISLIIIAFFALLLMIPEQATAQRFGHFTPHAVMPRPMPMPRPEPRPIPPGPRVQFLQDHCRHLRIHIHILTHILGHIRYHFILIRYHFLMLTIRSFLMFGVQHGIL